MPKVLRLQVKARADVLASNKFGYTSLLEAAGYGQSENIQMLLSLGAVLMVRAKDGYTPLHAVAENGYTEFIDTLLEAGA